MAFRLEIADFGAFYERTYDLAYRTALGICREPGCPRCESCRTRRWIAGPPDEVPGRLSSAVNDDHRLR